MKPNPILEELKNSLVENLRNATQNMVADVPEIYSALNRAQDLSFPTSKQEEWKYSPFTIPKGVEFKLAKIDKKGVASIPAHFEDCTRVVFVDGHYEPSLSDRVNTNELLIIPLRESPKPFEHRIPGLEDTLFDQLNLASSLLNGIQVTVKARSTVANPIVFVHYRSGDLDSTWIQPRIHIQVEEMAEATFAEIREIPQTQTQVANAVTEIHIDKGAHVQWINLEMVGESSSLINQNRVEIHGNGVFQHYVVSLGNGYIRNNLEIKINGIEGDAHMYGLSLGDGRLHVDHHTFVNHKAPNTTSNQLYKSLLSGKSNGVFNGKILVDQTAQKTNAYQSSKNILLSSDAKVNAKPQLEIFADDVKCSHGATIGQLDEEPVFYLRSRGLDEATARQLLMHAFAGEILEKIQIPSLQKWIEEKVEVYMNSMLQNA